MADLNARNLAAIKSGSATPQQLYEALIDLQAAHNNIAQQTNAAPVGENPEPTGHSAISVKGGAGMYDVQLTDNSPKYRDHHNFVEYSTDEGFSNAHVVSLGPSRNWRGSLGAGPYHFRSYSQYPTTGPSEMTYHPTPVSAHGSAEPPMQHGQGSGTSSTAGSGFGSEPFTGDVRPTR